MIQDIFGKEQMDRREYMEEEQMDEETDEVVYEIEMGEDDDMMMMMITICLKVK
jgi:hypothetical protein